MVLAVVAMMVVGCGGEPSIDGTWWLDVNSGCGVAYGFNTHEKTYRWILGCQIGPQSVGGEMEGGDADFSVAGQVTGTPRETSCLTSDHLVETAHYWFNGEQLAFATASGVSAMNRIKDMATTMTGTLSYGCWTANGFEPHPIQGL